MHLLPNHIDDILYIVLASSLAWVWICLKSLWYTIKKGGSKVVKKAIKKTKKASVKK